MSFSLVFLGRRGAPAVVADKWGVGGGGTDDKGGIDVIDSARIQLVTGGSESVVELLLPSSYSCKSSTSEPTASCSVRCVEDIKDPYVSEYDWEGLGGV